MWELSERAGPPQTPGSKLHVTAVKAALHALLVFAPLVLLVGCSPTAKDPASWNCKDFKTKSASSRDDAYAALYKKFSDNPATKYTRGNNLDEAAMKKQLPLVIAALCSQNGSDYQPANPGLQQLGQIADGQSPALADTGGPSAPAGQPSAPTGNGSGQQPASPPEQPVPNGGQPQGSGANAAPAHLPVCDPNTPVPPCVTTDSAGNVTYTYRAGGPPPSGSQLQSGGSTPNSGSAGSSGNSESGPGSGNSGSGSGNSGSGSGNSGSGSGSSGSGSGSSGSGSGSSGSGSGTPGSSGSGSGTP